MKNRTKKLRNVLFVNGLFSGLNGLFAVSFYRSLGESMSVENELILILIGCGLILFSISIFAVLMNFTKTKKWVGWITIQDWIWVIGVLLLITWQPFTISDSGYWLLGIVSIPVLILATFQSSLLLNQNRSN